MPSFEGKVALVTGGSSGIGRIAALRFAQEGAKVVIASRRPEEGNRTVQQIEEGGGEALFVKTDVSQATEVEALVNKTLDAFCSLDCAFNNAGTEPVAESSEDVWDRTIAINLKGAWLSLKYQVPVMQRQGGGAIVFTSSIAGMVGMPGTIIYSASKSGVIGMAKAAAIEYANAGIRINVISPGAIDTPMTDRMFGNSEVFQQQMAPLHPIGRVGRPEDIAEVALWLCSDAASFITGQTIIADGGYTAQ